MDFEVFIYNTLLRDFPNRCATEDMGGCGEVENIFGDGAERHAIDAFGKITSDIMDPASTRALIV